MELTEALGQQGSCLLGCDTPGGLGPRTPLPAVPLVRSICCNRFVRGI